MMKYILLFLMFFNSNSLNAQPSKILVGYINAIVECRGLCEYVIRHDDNSKTIVYAEDGEDYGYNIFEAKIGSKIKLQLKEKDNQLFVEKAQLLQQPKVYSPAKSTKKIAYTSNTIEDQISIPQDENGRLGKGCITYSYHNQVMCTYSEKFKQRINAFDKRYKDRLALARFRYNIEEETRFENGEVYKTKWYNLIDFSFK